MKYVKKGVNSFLFLKILKVVAHDVCVGFLFSCLVLAIIFKNSRADVNDSHKYIEMAK